MAFHDYDELQAKPVKQTEGRGIPPYEPPCFPVVRLA
jgi:hypothetical protein